MKDLGGKVVRELHVINALAAEMSAGQAVASPGTLGLRRDPHGRVHASGDPLAATQLLSKIRPDQLPTSYLVSTNAYKVWDKGTGAGVGVAVLDTGIAGDLPDFRASQSDSARGSSPRRS